jgi:hypothetical protein
MGAPQAQWRRRRHSLRCRTYRIHYDSTRTRQVETREGRVMRFE